MAGALLTIGIVPVGFLKYLYIIMLQVVAAMLNCCRSTIISKVFESIVKQYLYLICDYMTKQIYS